MTRAQALATMNALRPLLIASGLSRIASVDGLDGDLGQITLATPVGFTSAVVPLGSVFPVVDFVPLVAKAQAVVRQTLRPFEGDCGRGFNGRRGKLEIGSPGYSANDGWV